MQPYLVYKTMDSLYYVCISPEKYSVDTRWLLYALRLIPSSKVWRTLYMT